MTADVFNGLGVRVGELSREEFLKVRETLTRVGVLDESTNTLKQTCFILHKRGQYALMHHLEMRAMDGEGSYTRDEDVGHRNTVAHLLATWGLLRPLEPASILQPRAAPGSVVVVPHKAKGDYTLRPMYEIGRSRTAY